MTGLNSFLIFSYISAYTYNKSTCSFIFRCLLVVSASTDLDKIFCMYIGDITLQNDITLQQCDCKSFESLEVV